MRCEYVSLCVVEMLCEKKGQLAAKTIFFCHRLFLVDPNGEDVLAVCIGHWTRLKCMFEFKKYKNITFFFI